MGTKTRKLDGTLLQRFYSPRGRLEGVLLATGTDIFQVVLEHSDERHAASLLALADGSAITLQVDAEALPRRAGSQHPVYVLKKLMGTARTRAADGLSGMVTAFHFARHGEPNGVMLDSGHFVHTGPEGLARFLQLDVGDLIQVRGPSLPLCDGTGMVIEATHINGKAIGCAKAQKAVKKATKKTTRETVTVKKAAQKAVKTVTKNVSKKRSMTGLKKRSKTVPEKALR